MAKYKLLDKAFINNRLCAEGEIVTVPDDTIPGPHMLPVDAAALKAAKRAGLEVHHPVGDFVNELTATASESKPVIPGIARGTGATKVDPAQVGGSPENVPSGFLASDEQAVSMIRRII